MIHIYANREHREKEIINRDFEFYLYYIMSKTHSFGMTKGCNKRMEKV